MKPVLTPAKGTALVVLSGGQDSATCLYWALKRWSKVEAITFDYGQRHRVELDCAAELCKKNGIPHRLVTVSSLAQLSANALTDASVEVKAEGGYKNLPSTFVPGRNALFLSIAAAYAVPRGISDIVVGVCQTDYSGYPDCREEFIAAQELALSLAMDTPIVIHRPLMSLTKGEIFGLAAQLGALTSVLEESHTCYEGNHEKLHVWGYGCGKCPACLLRKKGYEDFLKSPPKELLHATR